MSSQTTPPADPDPNPLTPKESYGTRLKDWLSLVRIQSVPLTAVTLCIGYVTVTQTLSMSLLPLIIVGAIGHMGFYGLNDIFDYPHDAEQGKSDKPLIDGCVNIEKARIVCWSLIGASIGLSFILFPPLSVLAYLISALFGYIYNAVSKTDTYSSIYLSGWGFAIVWTGALYAGGYTVLTYIISCTFAAHMFWMTMMGDIRDIRGDEPNLLKVFNCEWTNNRLGTRFKITEGFTYYVGGYSVILQVIGLYMIVLGAHEFVSVATLVLSLVVPPFIWTAVDIMESGIYTIEMKTRLIVFNEITFVAALCVTLITILDILVVGTILLGSVGWGVIWLRLIHGSFTQFA